MSTLQFGKHKGKTLQDLMDIDQGYILWLAGIHMSASFHVKSSAAYNSVKEQHPEIINEAKCFIENKCKRCLQPSTKQPHCVACDHAINNTGRWR